MLTRWLRRLMRQELDAATEDMAAYLADLIDRNNEKIEQDLVDLGVVSRDA